MKLTMSLSQVNERPNFEQARARQQAMHVKKQVEDAAVIVACLDGKKADVNKDAGDPVVLSAPNRLLLYSGEAKFTPPKPTRILGLIKHGRPPKAGDIHHAHVETTYVGAPWTVSKLTRKCGVETYVYEHQGKRWTTEIDTNNDTLSYTEEKITTDPNVNI